MVFSSPVFLFIFLPLVLALYFAANTGLRNLILLVASLLFYSWGEAPWVMLASIGINYALGLWVERLEGRRAAWVVVALCVVVNLALIATFKYAGFLLRNVNALLALFGARPVAGGDGDLPDALHLPLGISFFTFHAMSYVIDIYRRQARAMRNPLNMALYISFFPQLIAGPIIRYHEIASQFLSRRVTAEGFADGARRFVIGLGKKMLIANTVAVAADGAFSADPDRLTPGMAWLGVVCYTLQIYYDFSGYSDMAIGLGRMFGFTFPENFNYPYVSASITEFWRRWHITLSNWFRDYLYIPLGGNRRGPLRTYANLLTVFFLCGLWHGASWTLVAWGLFHGTFLIVERLAARARGGAPAGPTWRPFAHVYALAVVMVGWVFFRAESFGQATTFLRAMMGQLPAAGAVGLEYDPRQYLNHETMLAILAGVVGAMPLARGIRLLADRLADGTAAPAPARPLLTGLVACASVVVLAS